jgi:hypothetical protein
VEKQRLEQDVDSLRHFMEEERKEMAELRRQQQVTLMYIKKYEYFNFVIGKTLNLEKYKIHIIASFVNRRS